MNRRIGRRGGLEGWLDDLPVRELVDLGRWRDRNLEQGAAREVDAVAWAAMRDQRDDGNRHAEPGHPIRDVPAAHPIDVDAVQNLEHWFSSRC